MSEFSLYTRMHEFGTLAESHKEVPDARFALPSTINWMRALAILVDDQKLNFKSAQGYYSKKTQRRILSEREVNSVCEQLLFALNQIASLHVLMEAKNKADVARIAIMAWYYGVYGSASAMIAAADGSFPDTHMATAIQWDRHFPTNGLAMFPFSDRLSNLVQSSVDSELEPVRARGKHSLVDPPKTAPQGWGCVAEYLSGTADWEQWNIEQRVRDTREFKALGVDNFRTKAARELRDAAFQKRCISFLHEASRYRGKANYRDAIYLAYGKGVPKLVDGFVADLTCVLTGFSAMAAGYISVRMGSQHWQAFISDLEDKRSISISPLSIWS